MTDDAKKNGPLIQDFEPSERESAFLSAGRGVRFVPDKSFRDFDGHVHQPEAYTLAKWLGRHEPALSVDIEDAPVVELRSAEYWLPLAFLATDVALPFYLNVAANYVYDKARGALKHDRTEVHLEAVYQDRKTGKTKRFSYSGSVDGLRACVKKLDIGSVMKD